MRRLASRVVSSLLAVVAVSCSDSATSLHRTPLRIALLPRFSAQAQQIYQNLSAFAVALDNVHVVVHVAAGDEAGPVLKDTTIAFPATADQVTIDLDLEIHGTQQNVAATVELREGTTAYFSGTQDFLAKQGATATAPEPVGLNYVGPGATAAFISLSPQPATLAPLTSLLFVAHAFDASEQTITGLPLTWSTADSSIATVSQAGLVTTTGKSGSTSLIAMGLNGVTGQAVINVQPAVRLTVIAGDNQSGLAGLALPTKLQVQAFDANGNAVIGATVSFTAVGGGSVLPASATTDVTGVASTTLTLGTGIGTYAFTATVAGSPNVTTRVASSATAAAAAVLGLAGGANQIDTVLATLGKALSVKVTDAFGNPVQQQAIDFQVTSGQAGLVAVPGTAPQTLVHTSTDNTGVAQATLVAGRLAGTVGVTASSPQTSLTPVAFAETLQAGAPKLLAILQQPSTAAQATLPLGAQPKVQVTDLYGNAVGLGGLTILVSPVVDCSSRACGVAVAPGATGSSLNRKVSAPTTRRFNPTGAVSTSRLSAPTAIAATRSVSDTLPQGIGGTTQVTTDPSGVATFTNLSMNLSVGAWQLEFFDAKQALAPATSQTIAVSPGPIESIVAWGVADTTTLFTTVDTLFPSVRVIDKVGNGIAGIPVSWSADPLSILDSANTKTTTDANGIAAGGQWIVLFAKGQSFGIVATPTPSNIENSPLKLTAFISLIGLAAPTKVPSTPP
ncbi:MAG TPA: hypothetical protein VGH98_01565 [Gemmatimonadaceae bacterium]|jgi:hypothetical protein